MTRRTGTLRLGGAALATAAWLALGTLPAQAQWWADDDAYEVGSDQGLFSDLGPDNDGIVGGLEADGPEFPGNEDEVALDGDDERFQAARFGESRFDDAVGEPQENAGYYDEDFGDDSWNDWF